jgi:Flp pilus assembly protein TadG
MSKTLLFKEEGQALILIALAAVGLFAITALAIDGSARFSDRRHAQNAADTAAMAAALEKVNGLTMGETDSVCSTDPAWTNTTFCEEIINAAWDRAEQNGYDGLLSNNVELYSPPISGYYTGDDAYVQVIITSTVNTYFARVIGIKQTQNVVQAVASVHKGGPLFDGASIVSLDPSPNCSSGGGSGGGSVDIGGAGTINLNGGGIFINSDASCGYSHTSCAVNITVSNGAGIYSAGSDINENCTVGIPQDEAKDQIVIPDEVFYPDKPIQCDPSYGHPAAQMIGINPTTLVQTWEISPGYYTDFPQGGLIPNNKHIVLQPGVYCVDNDISWSGATFKSLDASAGVTIYLTEGHSISININSPIELDPSSTGDYKGYVIIVEGDQDDIQSCTINGGSYLVIDGTIFAPYCDVTINGDNSSQSVFNAQIIGWDIKINGGSVINFTYNPGTNAQIKRKIGLMK